MEQAERVAPDDSTGEVPEITEEAAGAIVDLMEADAIARGHELPERLGPDINVAACMTILEQIYREAIDLPTHTVTPDEAPQLLRDVMMLCQLDELRRIREAIETFAIATEALTNGPMAGVLAAQLDGAE